MRIIAFLTALLLCLGVIGAAGLYARSLRQPAGGPETQTEQSVPTA